MRTESFAERDEAEVKGQDDQDGEFAPEKFDGSYTERCVQQRDALIRHFFNKPDELFNEADIAREMADIISSDGLFEPAGTDKAEYKKDGLAGSIAEDRKRWIESTYDGIISLLRNLNKLDGGEAK